MDNVALTQTCFKCGTTITSLDKFCSNCGSSLELPSTTIGRQIFIYAISFFLPPFGLKWIFKYFKSPQQKAHVIAWVIIFLTIISIIISIWTGMIYINDLKQQINSASLGY